MKILILQADGMPDYPVKELGGKTPLESADTPNLDQLTKRSIMGITNTIPAGLPPGSDVGNLSILGYNPKIYYTGRAPLEALSMGLKLNACDIAYRCNLVTLDASGSNIIMKDYSAGHVTTEEAKELISFINQNLRYPGIRFFPGVSYRHIMLWSNGSDEYKCTPPHDITGREINDFLPRGKDRFLQEMIFRSLEILNNHPVNLRRKQAGKPPANAIWLWGQGRATSMPSIRDKMGLKGAIIAGVDLIKGIGKAAGLDVINVNGATGYLDTNYEGKGTAACEALRTHDLVFLHLEAPDEAGHNGNYQDKVKSIEFFDKRLLGTIMKNLNSLIEEIIIIVLSDHPTPCSVKTHVAEPVPFLIYHNRQTKHNINPARFTELNAKKSGVVIEHGWELLENVVNQKIFKII